MSRLFLPTTLFIGGVIGMVVCLFAFIEGRDYPLQFVIALLFAVLGGREIAFELGRKVGEGAE